MAEGRIRVTKHAVNGEEFIFLPLGALEAWLETRDFDLGKPNEEKFIEVFFAECRELSSMTNFAMQLGYRNRLTDVLMWTNEMLVDGNLPLWLPPSLPSTRYVRFRIRDTSVSGVWKLSALELWGQLDGGRI